MQFVTDAIQNYCAEHAIRRVTFLVASPLSCTPIHVAMLDGVVVSYLPALLALSKDAPAQAENEEQLASVVIGTDADDLKMAPIEAKKVASMVDGNVILRERGEIDVDEIVNLMPKIRQLHFAGHGSFSHGDPMASSLHFANGKAASMQDILDSQKTTRFSPCEHVFFSACNSSTADFMWLRNEGASIALSAHKAFRARAVVGSLWPVQDLFCYFFVVKYYELLGDGTEYAATLRNTQRWFRDLEYENFLEDLHDHPELWGDLDEEVMGFLGSSHGRGAFAKRERTWSAFTLIGIPEIT
jgi:CHAT domain-containing protein